MKVRALASLSGPMGCHSAGDEFIVDPVLGEELIARRLVEVVTDEREPAAEPTAKPVKDKPVPKE